MMYLIKNKKLPLTIPSGYFIFHVLFSGYLNTITLCYATDSAG